MIRPMTMLGFCAMVLVLASACAVLLVGTRPAEPGIVVVLAAEAISPVSPALMEETRTIVEARLDALGVRDSRVTIEGTRLRVELTGVDDPTQAIATLSQQGLLEFVDAGHEFLPPGTAVRTTYPDLWADGATTHVVSATVPVTPTGSLTPTVLAGAPAVFATVVEGHHLKTAQVQTNTKSGRIGIAFDLTDEGARYFKDFTTAHADNDQQPFYYLSIVLDKKVIWSPHIVTPITESRGQIYGNFTLHEARSLAIQLRYGALPVKLTVESVRTVP